ncbi:MAG: hypothetical protein ACRCY4_05650 [Brevinema sp.]
MKQFLAYLFVLHFFIGHIIALNIIPKLHVYPSALRPSYCGAKLALTRENRPTYDDISFQSVTDNKQSFVEFSFTKPQFLNGIHQLFLTILTAPRRMNLSVQPPPSFNMWYARNDWFP